MMVDYFFLLNLIIIANSVYYIVVICLYIKNFLESSKKCIFIEI